MRHMKENEKLDTFKKISLGNYVLKSIDQKNPFGSFYLDNLNNWNNIKGKHIYLNLLDENFENSLQKLKTVLIENFLKKNFIIMRFESNNSSIAFYLNNLPNIINDELSIAEILINNTDFIDSIGIPEYNKMYNLVYYLNDPSKEINIVKTPNTTIKSNKYDVFSLNTKVKKPIGNPIQPKKYPSVPKVPPGTSPYMKGPEIKKYNDALIQEDNQPKKILKHNKHDNRIYYLIVFILFAIIFMFLIIFLYQSKKIIKDVNVIDDMKEIHAIVIITTTEIH